MDGITSRKTCEFSGLAPGSSNASDSATDFRDGTVRPVPGVLPMVIAASAHGIRRVFVPEPQAAEAGLVPGMTVFGVRSLRTADGDDAVYCQCWWRDESNAGSLITTVAR